MTRVMITLILLTIQQTFMKTSSPVILLCTLLVAACMVLPVSAAVPAGNATPAGAAAVAATANQPFIVASASPSVPVVGEPVTINGVATGGNLTAGVQIWYLPAITSTSQRCRSMPTAPSR
jgi:hypothetical protein